MLECPGHGHPLNPHELRHAFITLGLDAGATLRDLQRAVAHADPRTTANYDRRRKALDTHLSYLVERLSFCSSGAAAAARNRSKMGTGSTGCVPTAGSAAGATTMGRLGGGGSIIRAGGADCTVGRRR